MKTNTKNNVLKLAMTVMAVFMFTAVMGQVADGDYVKYSDALTSPSEIDYVTVGAQMGYYALPDPVYHPDYNSGSGWVLTSSSSWQWTMQTEPASGDATIQSDVNWDANYVEILFGATGNYVVRVAETTTTCVSSSFSEMNVTALPAPTAVIAGGNTNDWTEVTPLYEFYNCEGLAEDLTITITETGVPAALASYAYSIEKKVEEIDELGAPVTNGNNITDATFVNNTVAEKLLSGNEVGGATHTVTTGAMPLILDDTNTDPVRTRYTFTLKKASDASGAEGIVSAISHKSDFGSTVQTHPFGAEVSVVYVVNLPPVTGPIYHIPNNFAL